MGGSRGSSWALFANHFSDERDRLNIHLYILKLSILTLKIIAAVRITRYHVKQDVLHNTCWGVFSSNRSLYRPSQPPMR